MSSQLTVSLKSRVREGVESWEGTVQIPGLRATKLCRQSDGTTQFATVSALKSSARTFARKLGVELTYEEPKSRRAAKRSPK